MDGEGNILVADCWNHHIQKLKTEGQFLISVGNKGNGFLQFEYPHGITYNPTNNKVYVVDDNHRVQVLNSDLAILGREVVTGIIVSLCSPLMVTLFPHLEVKEEAM